MSVAMLEAMAAHRPIVSTNVGGVDEALGLRDRATPAGWIVPRNDAEALVRALRDVLSSMRTAPETVRSRVDEAAWRMQNWFTSERMVEDYERVLDPLRSNGVDAS
jgi:glycosyltransferase involved in cell wall biosynthesis